jgi:spore coat polysaccharide biosynthesis protein SpsF (cytidylyltransferase family)
MGSTRLPGKTLRNLGGITLVESVFRGASSAETLDEIVVSIPDSKSDDILFDFLTTRRIPVSRGLENDLLSRHIQVANEYSSDFIVRIPGDNPLPHGREVDKIVNCHIRSNPFGFSTNLSQTMNSGYPDGIGAEIFLADTLRKVESQSHSQAQKEHVHLNFLDYENSRVLQPDRFPVRTILCPNSYARPDIVLDINEAEDLEYFRRMFEDLGTNQPGIEDIIPWHDAIGQRIRGNGEKNE